MKSDQCKCIFYREHSKECEFAKIRKSLLNEALTIPVIGFNSGKYDMCFVVNELDKLDMKIGPTISKGSGSI